MAQLKHGHAVAENLQPGYLQMAAHGTQNAKVVVIASWDRLQDEGYLQNKKGYLM